MDKIKLMRPVPCWLLFSFSAMFLTFTACSKKNTTPPVPTEPIETPIPHPLIASITTPDGSILDTFIYDKNNRLTHYRSYNYSYTRPEIDNITYTYDNLGKLTNIGYPGNTYDFTASYITNDSLVTTHSQSGLKNMYRFRYQRPSG